MKNIVEIQNNAFNSAVKKLQVPNMEKVDVIIIRQPHGKRFYLVVSFKTHMHARTHTHEPLETITMSAFNPRLQKKNSRQSKALKLLIFHHNLLLSVPQIHLSFTQVLSAKMLVF